MQDTKPSGKCLYLSMNLLVNPISAEGAQELPNSLKYNWQVLVFMDREKSRFYSLKRDAKNW